MNFSEYGKSEVAADTNTDTVSSCLQSMQDAISDIKESNKQQHDRLQQKIDELFSGLISELQRSQTSDQLSTTVVKIVNSAEEYPNENLSPKSNKHSNAEIIPKRSDSSNYSASDYEKIVTSKISSFSKVYERGKRRNKHRNGSHERIFNRFIKLKFMAAQLSVKRILNYRRLTESKFLEWLHALYDDSIVKNKAASTNCKTTFAKKKWKRSCFSGRRPRFK